jgi:AraC-like DNA-binding protein
MNQEDHFSCSWFILFDARTNLPHAHHGLWKMNKNRIEHRETNGRSLSRSVSRCHERGFRNGGAVFNNGKSDDVRKIEQSIAYMMEHLNKPLQVATLAAATNVSASHFFVLFKRCTGCPPIDYFIRLRMYCACELLKAGSLHVKEVAAALGYDDPFYFSRVFKSVNQIAPSEYRLKQKQLNGTPVERHILPASLSFTGNSYDSERRNLRENNSTQKRV